MDAPLPAHPHLGEVRGVDLGPVEARIRRFAARLVEFDLLGVGRSGYACDLLADG